MTALPDLPRRKPGDARGLDLSDLRADPRASLRARALRLEYLTVGWNLAEGGIAVAAARASGSIALLGFGLDSFVECASAFILIWRFRAEARSQDHAAVERLDRRAHRLVAISLLLLALWVALDAGLSLWNRERPHPTRIGMALTACSLVVMPWLARAKRRAAAALESRALVADAFQTTACWWLSLIVLGGIGLNALAGWWWADPAAALGVSLLLIRESREAWWGDTCDC